MPNLYFMFCVFLKGIVNSHVLNCSKEGVGSILSMNGLLAQAKVSEDNMTLAIQHDILWLQIPTQCYMIKSMEQEMEGKSV